MVQKGPGTFKRITEGSSGFKKRRFKYVIEGSKRLKRFKKAREVSEGLTVMGAGRIKNV